MAREIQLNILQHGLSHDFERTTLTNKVSMMVHVRMQICLCINAIKMLCVANGGYKST